MTITPFTDQYNSKRKLFSLSGYVSANTFKTNVVSVVCLPDIKPSCCSLVLISRLRCNLYHYQSSGSKRVMRQNKNPDFVGLCNQCISPGGAYVLVNGIRIRYHCIQCHSLPFYLSCKGILICKRTYVYSCMHTCTHIHSVCNTYSLISPTCGVVHHNKYIQ